MHNILIIRPGFINIFINMKEFLGELLSMHFVLLPFLIMFGGAGLISKSLVT